MDLVEMVGLERIGFLTVTFADNPRAREAQRRFHSLRTHILVKRYEHFIRVFARTKRGRIHYHVLLVLKDDIRSGVDFDEFSSGNYRSAPESLREEWNFLRDKLARYGFGRFELLPVWKNSSAVSNYLCQNIAVRRREDKGVRLVAYSRGVAAGSASFSWVKGGGRLWREGVGRLASSLGCKDYVGLKALLGPKWAFGFQGLIIHTSPDVASLIAALRKKYLPKNPSELCRRRFIRELRTLQRGLWVERPTQRPVVGENVPVRRTPCRADCAVDFLPLDEPHE